MQEENSFGQWLKRRRKTLDLTQAALARAVPCAVQTIRALEADELRPSRQLAARLAQALGLPESDHAVFVAFARGQPEVPPPAAGQVPVPTAPTRALDGSPINLPVPHTPQSGQAHDSTAPAARPSGTVTFLFTDIVGSTRLWEHHPTLMPAAFRRQEAILRQAIADHAGYAYKMVGDALQAAFATAPAALAAALAAQRALAAEDWGAIGALRVRMALDSGAVEERADDYVGPLLNRAARLVAAAHGGQVLLSVATKELVWTHLPPGIILFDLGTHQLKDLARPEPIFQAVASDLPADFPPLNTATTRSNNLPAQPTRFIGREQEVEAIRLCLRDPTVRLLTLSGPGGTGKTRLALQVATTQLDDYADGVWFVDLAPIRDPALVVQTVVHALNLKESMGQPSIKVLKAYLRGKRLLLILDNFEQVLAAAPAVAELLAAAPALTVLITSRFTLGVYGEHNVPVPPLMLPDLARLPPVERLIEYAAVRLFAERASAVEPHFTVTAEHAQAVAEICTRLDGLPLAIELAAARSRLLSPAALLARLDNALRLLTVGARTLPERQQTLRSTIDWSYRLLDASEQTLFARLAVFTGGWTLDAAEAICNADGVPRVDVLGGLQSLLDKSLVQEAAPADGDGGAGHGSALGTHTPHSSTSEPRFLMLETIREYALERLEARGEADALRRQHATFYLALAEAASTTSWWQNQEVAQARRLGPEQGNLRAALDWASDQGAAELLLRLCGALRSFWIFSGLVSEGRRWIETALAMSGPLPAPLRAQALAGAARLGRIQGDYPWARKLAEQSLALARDMGDIAEIATALRALADIIRNQGDYGEPETLYRESLALSQQIGDHAGIAWLLLGWGELAQLRGDFAQAQVLHQQSMAHFEELQNTVGCALSLVDQGHVAQHRGDAERAWACFAASLARLQELEGQTWGRRWAASLCLAGFACVAACRNRRGGDAEDSWMTHRNAQKTARLFGAAEALLEAGGIGAPPAHRIEIDRNMAAARAQVEAAVWDAAWAEGRAMPLERAIAYALDEGHRDVAAF